MNERTDERVAQYLRLYFCLIQTTVPQCTRRFFVRCNCGFIEPAQESDTRAYLHIAAMHSIHLLIGSGQDMVAAVLSVLGSVNSKLVRNFTQLNFGFTLDYDQICVFSRQLALSR